MQFQGDLYGRTLRLEFEARLRAEKAFAGAEQLVDQIRKDVEHAREVLEKA
jgi:riboflavin kinase/FMN adenylyltransferase